MNIGVVARSVGILAAGAQWANTVAAELFPAARVAGLYRRERMSTALVQ